MDNKRSMQFSDLDLIPALQKAVSESGYVIPTPIQVAAIPHLLEGRDLLGCAQTGTGKTAAFALPILHRLAQSQRPSDVRPIRALVLTPTRELAVQIHESFETYGKNLPLRTVAIYGGVHQGPQTKKLARGADILIATPGRLLDLMSQRHVKVGQLEILVLDEADRMLDMGFIGEIRKLIGKLPAKRQNLFFSATMPPSIEKFASSFLTNPVRVEAVPTVSTAERIKQSVMFVERNNKRDLLRHVLKDKNLKRVIVFTRTKRGANNVSELLARNGISSTAIHGNKSQGARQRALNEFRLGRVRVLVATDVAARGIDVDDISHVINFELPNDSESYIHRIGRTARAGANGSAISFCDSEERAYLKDIEKVTKQAIPVVLDQPFHSVAVASGPLISKAKAKAIIEGRGGRRGGPAASKRFGKRGQRFAGPGGGGHSGGGGGSHRGNFPKRQSSHSGGQR